MSLNADFLRQRSVVVVGGGSGIGRAVAQEAADAGAQVYVLGRSPTASGPWQSLRADVTDSASLDAAFAEIGRIDHLVLTAGARVGSPTLAAVEWADFERTFNVKLFGAVLAVRQALPYLAADASVTFTSGLLSRKYGAGGLLKSTVNAALEAAAKNLAKELAPRRVNVVSPGVVDTELWGPDGAESRQAAMARIGAGLPLGRVGRPQDLAQAYLFAMGNAFLTGAVLDVDGGGLL
ncbi:SDR family oxidoreductase [Chromobacterium subtsugae]|uniref:SDR family oxidoreductase n=1 Tax=Chromobacterium subtsugae TaxID=251747 RepID=A0ABS7FJC7_9NEIS|nr:MULTISPECIES: SDR family oxidoreductase [Chromobacterium]KUM02869.1 dehydrogenase [Chromobacterium subtsugae]KZE84086.1 dehydrogenase [Chromobacterium sp. F49]MBW7568608.1 SDR family oxidoreductase [Chromobacterium subtsugae]MBW8290194.1 SDR family oxidoreductase [Chromobacterium subtsugae]WSE93593.1 SDR family oxidoreductase [Chromobacterium subtsugae]